MVIIFQVDELLHCYLETMNCDLFRKATFQPRLPDRPPSLYVGVNGTNTTITMLTGSTLALLTGTEIDLNQTFCQNNETDRVRNPLILNCFCSSRSILMFFLFLDLPIFMDEFSFFRKRHWRLHKNRNELLFSYESSF